MGKELRSGLRSRPLEYLDEDPACETDVPSELASF